MLSPIEAVLLAIAGGTAYSVYPALSDGDTVYIAQFVAAICLFRILNPMLIMGPFFDYINKNSSYSSQASRDAARAKFGSHMNKMILHGVFQVWGYNVLVSQAWWTDFHHHESWWAGWDPLAPHVTGEFRAYYLAQLSFFIASLVMQFFEPRSHDHVAMLAHHWGAATLIVLSYMYNTVNIGLVVLVSREITDVMIHMARGLALVHFKTLAEMILVILMCVWFVTRNYYHTFVTCNSAWRSPTFEWDWNMWLVFNTLLGLLIPLDLYYLWLGCSAIAKRIMYPNNKSIDPDVPDSPTGSPKAKTS